MTFAVDRARLFSTIRSRPMELQISVGVLRKQGPQSCVWKPLRQLLFFDVGHLSPSGFQSRRHERNFARRLLARHSRLHVEVLTTAPQSAHFSIARVFD